MFVHLNVHSYYSMGWGTASPEPIVEAAQRMGTEQLALTDTNGIYCLRFFLDYCKTFGVAPIVGAEIEAGGLRATLVVRDRRGYENMCRLLTERHLFGGMGGDPEFKLSRRLPELCEGLTVLTSSPTLLGAIRPATDFLFAEISPGYSVRETLAAAKTLGIRPVATARAFWVKPDDYELHRLLRAIHLNTTLSKLPEAQCAPKQARLLGEAEMRRTFSYCPEAVDNTLVVADQCGFVPEFGTVYPEVKPGLNGHSIDVLRKLTYEGAERRYGMSLQVGKSASQQVRERLEMELELIEQKGFAPVFLVVEDIVKRFRRTCGRGSAAASIVSYCLGITHVEPLRHNLFFERFINEARMDPPDIDIDFAWDERDDVLDYVFKRYGVDRAAMVANHVSFQKRAAVREIAKVYGLTDAEIGTVTKRMSHGFGYIGTPVTEHPALRDHGFPEPWPEILALAERLEDIPRHLSVHCGGVVITPGETCDWVPTQMAAKGVRIIQWEKDQTEESGLVKIDLLGNRSLAVIRDTLAAIKEHHGVEIEYEKFNPIDDPKAQELVAKGDTMGVFYVESPATRLLAKKAGVGDYEHLVLHSSIIRPAANPFINMYLRRLKGEPWEPLHPLIGDILDETYGIMVYQEDVTKVAMALAGFSLKDAEELRKIISKKHKHRRLADLLKQFYAWARERGVDDDAIKRVWDMIMSFAGYSFCKPHSASYALVSFKSAYLRAHYPAEFIAVVISNQGGFYSTFAYVSEARRMGLKVLPPDINESEVKYTGRDKWIRVGLMQIKGLNAEAMRRVIEERLSGRYMGFEDCVRRTAIGAADARLLVKAGCFDRLEPKRTRPELLWELVVSRQSSVVSHQSSVVSRQSSVVSHQSSVVSRQSTVVNNGSAVRQFDSSAVQNTLFTQTIEAPPETPQYDERTLLEQEIETLDFLISRHPLTLYQDRLVERPVVKAKDLEKHVGRKIEVAGWLVTAKVVVTRKQEPMEFVTFEDTTGLIETVFFPDAFRKFSHMLSRTRPYRLFGKVEEDFGAVTMTVERVEWL